MAYQRATITTRTASLASEFGLEYATRLFGADTLAQLPRYVRGKNAGKLKGSLRWEKCEVGGWSRNHGGVVRPGLVRAALCEDTYGVNAYRGTYAGRTEMLDLSADFLGAEGRVRLLELHGQAAARVDAEREAAANHARECLAALDRAWPQMTEEQRTALTSVREEYRAQADALATA
jgi:hypothetical protein